MFRDFWDSEANKFTLYGAIFGFLFPVIATLIEAVQLGGITVENMIAVQRSDPLLWIIDSAPFWLGLFARFAGWRQDQLKKVIRENIPATDEVRENFEDSRQFAGVLTFLAASLVSVVLFLVIFWLQSLITSTLNNLPTNSTTVAVAGDNATGNDATGSGATGSGATGSGVTAANNAAQPVVIPPTATATPPAVPTVVVVAQVQPTIAPTVNEINTPPAIVTLPPATAEPTPTTPPAAVDRIRLGTVARSEIDCSFPTAVTAATWQEALGVEILLEEFASPDELFAALTDPTDPRHIDVTLCYVDPDDRSYLRQYLGALEITGSAFLEVGDKRLLAIRSTSPAAIGQESRLCINNYLRNQEYAPAVVDGEAAEWLAANRATAVAWFDCPIQP